MKKEAYIELLIELSNAIIRQPLPAWSLRCHWLRLVGTFPELGVYQFPQVSRECNFIADFREVRKFLTFVLEDIKKNRNNVDS